jgi:phosphatidylglycerol:prolipoprotein diacylglycerol transferase
MLLPSQACKLFTEQFRGVIPFLHLGPVAIPTFGLMVACAMLAAFFMLRADLIRRGLVAPTDNLPVKRSGKPAANIRSAANAEAEMLIAIPCLAGIVGAKLYHVLESPADFFAHPLGQIVSPYGFAWFGGLLAGFAAFVLVGRRQKIPLLTLLDAGSPASALGYGIGRIGCFLSGDGDYGIPTSLPWGMSFPNGLVPTTQRVHPTPIYELIVACFIAWWLWRIGARQIQEGGLKYGLTSVDGPANPELYAQLQESSRRRIPSKVPPTRASQPDRGQRRPPDGSVFASYLILTGFARFLVEFIRINPRSFLGMSNAQAAGLACVIAGAILSFWLAKHDRHTAVLP